MKCHRCDADVLPSSGYCDYCNRVSDDDLDEIRNSTAKERDGQKGMGMGLIVLGMLALVGAVVALFFGQGLRIGGGGGFVVILIPGVGIGLALGAAGAHQMEQSKLYHRLSRH